MIHGKRPRNVWLCNMALRISPGRKDKYTFEQAVWMDQWICARSTLKRHWERERRYFLSIFHSPTLVYIPLEDLSAVIQTPTLSHLEFPVHSDSFVMSLSIAPEWQLIAHLNFHPPLFILSVDVADSWWSRAKNFFKQWEWPTQSFEDKGWDRDSSFHTSCDSARCLEERGEAFLETCSALY